MLAVAAFFLAAARINHGLVDSRLPAGPGLTLDESFNIGQGVYLFESLMEFGPAAFTPAGAEEVFGHVDYFSDHPPLGRFVLGAAHQCMASSIGGAELSIFNVPAARLGSCLAFALTVFLLVEFVRRQFGIGTAVVSAVALLIMPRVVGHARIASLETMTSLAWLATLVPLWAWWTKPEAPTTRQAIFSGVMWGVLLLTKVQGILVPPLIVGWALWQYRERAIRPLVWWGFVGAGVFFAGWPWLWLDPVANTFRYLGRATERPTLYAWYLGQRYADKSVPWHFPFVMTIATLPVAVTALFGARLAQRRFERVEVLILLSTLWPLFVFAVPGTPVYDGVRLFLVIMPGFAILSARALFIRRGGAGECPNSSNANGKPRWRFIGYCVVGVFAVISFSRTLQPYCLNSYSEVVLNEAGAHRLGLEAGYWADALNGEFWQQVPEDSTVYVAPVLHQFQLIGWQQLVPIVAERNIKLEAFEYKPQAQRGLTLLLHRLADLPPRYRDVPAGAKVVAESQYGSVVLARLIDTSQSTWQGGPNWPTD